MHSATMIRCRFSGISNIIGTSREIATPRFTGELVSSYSDKSVVYFNFTGGRLAVWWVWWCSDNYLGNSSRLAFCNVVYKSLGKTDSAFLQGNCHTVASSSALK